MRIGCFEVQLIGADNIAYPERMIPIATTPAAKIGTAVRTSSPSSSSPSSSSKSPAARSSLAASTVAERPVVCAVPGEEYHVKINIYRKPSGQFPSKYLRLGLYVDGCDVQYWKRMDLSDPSHLPKDPKIPLCSRFWGFKRNTSDIRSFVFSTPAVVDSAAANAKQQQQQQQQEQKTQQPVLNSTALGTIRVVIYEATVSEGVMENHLGVHELPQQAVLAEGKKFWQQASVTTEAGQRVDASREQFRPLQRWQNCSERPMQVLELQYHTSSMVNFLANFTGSIATDSGGGSSASSRKDHIVSGSSSSGSSGAGDVRMKRKRGEVIDLTASDDDDDSNGNKNNDNDFSDLNTSTTTSAVSNGQREVPIDEEVSIVIRPKPQPPILDMTR